MPDLELECAYAHATTDEIAELTVAAVRSGSGDLQALLDELSAPIYVTDADGWVTFFNRACADFVGRTPLPGQDRWCVTWRLYTEGGAFLPHESCPLAESIRQRRPVHGIVAVAERPDGSRIMFMPHPAPVTDADGRLIGAVNILIDVTDQRQAAALRAQALRCRRLAQSVTDLRTVEALSRMALEYEDEASQLIG